MGGMSFKTSTGQDDAGAHGLGPCGGDARTSATDTPWLKRSRSMMQRREIHFGIIGCGLMGREFARAAARWFHLLDQDVVPRIVGVCDTNPNMLAWFTNNIDTIK